MGQTPLLNTNKLHNQWTYIDTLGQFQIFKNQHNHLAEKHIVKSDPKIDQIDYITAYSQRYLPNKPIVNAYDAQFHHKSNSMCQNTSVMTVYTEFIPYRLSDIKLLNHGQGIYVLTESLVGFAQLHARVGPFQINQDLIGFNKDGQVKVWYNPNFADNSVDNDRIILMSTINPYDFDRKFSQNQEHDMVQDTINAVARYTKFNPLFLHQAQQLKKVGFAQAHRILTNQISKKTYYVPDHLLLSDKSGIIQKSGVEPKHRHVFNPNKPKTGQAYPYFIEGQQRNQGQTHYIQGQPPHQNYNIVYDNDSQSSYTQHNNYQGGYYNLNGQNYRIVGTKTLEGNNIDQNVIIDEILKKNNQFYQQQENYAIDPNYTSVKSGVYRNRVEEQSQHVRKPKYQEGHIIINDSSHHTLPSRHNIEYSNVNAQYQPQKENVRVFSVGGDGRVQEQVHIGSPSSQLVYGERVQPVHSVVQPHLWSNQDSSRRIMTHEQIVAPVYQTRYTTEIPIQSVRHELPIQSNVNMQYQHIPVRRNINSPHRHRIFDQSPTFNRNLVREESRVDTQKVF